MKRLTIDDVMDMKPCSKYPEERIENLYKGRESLTLLEITNLDIDPIDIIWVMTQPNVLSREQLVEFANSAADRSARDHALKHPETARWAASWLDGSDRSERSAAVAQGAALAAEAAAAAAAALAAEWAALATWAERAAWAAAWAAEAAALAAAEAAATWAEAAQSERQNQINDLRRIVEGEK